MGIATIFSSAVTPCIQATYAFVSGLDYPTCLGCVVAFSVSSVAPFLLAMLIEMLTGPSMSACPSGCKSTSVINMGFKLYIGFGV